MTAQQLAESQKLGVSEEFKGSSNWGEYGDAIQELDHNVGRIFDSLKRLGIDDNTIVIYASDNGRGPGRTPEQKIRGHKLSTYEGGIRVPAIAWGPGLGLQTGRGIVGSGPRDGLVSDARHVRRDRDSGRSRHRRARHQPIVEGRNQHRAASGNEEIAERIAYRSGVAGIRPANGHR